MQPTLKKDPQLVSTFHVLQSTSIQTFLTLQLQIFETSKSAVEYQKSPSTVPRYCVDGLLYPLANLRSWFPAHDIDSPDPPQDPLCLQGHYEYLQVPSPDCPRAFSFSLSLVLPPSPTQPMPAATRTSHCVDSLAPGWCFVRLPRGSCSSQLAPLPAYLFSCLLRLLPLAVFLAPLESPTRSLVFHAALSPVRLHAPEQTQDRPSQGCETLPFVVVLLAALHCGRCCCYSCY